VATGPRLRQLIPAPSADQAKYRFRLLSMTPATVTRFASRSPASGPLSCHSARVDAAMAWARAC
jgi:hypothetical protein